MSAVLQKIAQELILQGYPQGGSIVSGLAASLRETGLIPDQLDSVDGPMARGRKIGPATFDIDPSKLKELRMGQNISQKTLSGRSALSPSFVHTVEKGKHASISAESARRLANGLGVDIEQLRREEIE
jgi:hypothetical protein